eukprot:TRINITY_DN47153_c0_g1_i1.p1 TRINITY_DN47153_c0_g1~~TRINITY_DN47153_c0_g1_i1.p1  ORF type:complete len:558 (-),score=116.26 TRINITY_DN47153_c0_g1_i1:119-1792(-)
MAFCAPAGKGQKEVIGGPSAETAHIMANFAAINQQLSSLTTGQQQLHATLQEIIATLQNVHGPKSKGNSVGSVRSSNSFDESLWKLKRAHDLAGISDDNDKVQKEEERARLTSMIETSEEEERRQMNESRKSWYRRFRDQSLDKMNTSIDIIIGVATLTNALFIGFQADKGTDPSPLWLVMDVIYSVIFISELITKIRLNGCWMQFCGIGSGSGVMSNWFDLLVVSIDSIQLIGSIFFPAVQEFLDQAPSSSIFRVVRLARLGRVLRLMKLEIFKDLVTMTAGLIGGIQTLSWSAVLFLLICYVIGLTFRETLGKQRPVEGISEYFDSVPRSMFTVFRCSFGDCSSGGGTPIFEAVQLEYGVVFSLIYSLFVWFIMIGLFNVIAAIFVESTMAAATMNEKEDQQKRLGDDVLFATRITTLIRVMMENSEQRGSARKALSEALEEVMSINVTKENFANVLADERARKALDELDINRDDHRYLSDILDPCNDGSLSVGEIVDGLERLRGDPRRSDIVAVDLMVRQLQTRLEQVCHLVQQTQRDMHDGHIAILEGVGNLP